jgi:hypothetical protein
MLRPRGGTVALAPIHPDRGRWIGFGVVCLGMMMTFLNITQTVSTLGPIQQSLHDSSEGPASRPVAAGAVPGHGGQHMGEVTAPGTPATPDLADGSADNGSGLARTGGWTSFLSTGV